MKRPGHVIFASDDNGFSQLQVALYSLLRTADSARDLSVSVLTGCGPLTEAHRAALREIAARYSFCRLEILDVDPLLARHAAAFANSGTCWSVMMWARCFIGELFAQEDGNVVYLDIDTLVCEDLGPLFERDLSDCGDGRPYVLGAVCEEHRESAAPDDPAFAGGLMDPCATRYFNSGFLVMNVTAFREERLLEKIEAWYVAHKQEAKRPDQDTLNALFWNRTLFLHPRYNHCDGWLERQGRERVSASHWRGNAPRLVLEAILRPAVLHFWGSRKPWRWNHRPEGRRYEAVMRELGVLSGALPGTSPLRRIQRGFFAGYHAILRRIAAWKLARLEVRCG